MRIDILKADNFINNYDCLEVTNPIYFNNKTYPTDDGLFSYRIFGGIGSRERKERFGYIKLKKKFLHPEVFYILSSMGNTYEKVIMSKDTFKLVNGELVQDDNGDTGLDFFYSIFDKLVFKETGTARRSDSIKLLSKLSKNEIFIDKLLVCPAFYRDFDTGGKTDEMPSVDEINSKYSKLLSLNNSLTNDGGYSFLRGTTESTIQNTINDIFLYFVSMLGSKTGIIHQNILGKTVDYSTRSVVSTQVFNYDSFDDMDIKFGYIGVPITQLCTLFYPFYVKFIQDFIIAHEFDIKAIDSKNKEIDRRDLDLKDIFSEDLIKKLLDLFIKSTEDRFQIITIADKANNIYSLEIFKEELGRDFTLMDLVYLATMDIVNDKHVYATRYPIENYLNCCPFRIRVLTTRKTQKVTIGSKIYPNYPLVFPDFPLSDSEVVDTLIPNSNYLQAFGMDFDGDTASIRGVYTVEANQEAERLIKSKSNILQQDGHNFRTLKNEGIQALYTLTL